MSTTQQLSPYEVDQVARQQQKLQSQYRRNQVDAQIGDREEAIRLSGEASRHEELVADYLDPNTGFGEQCELARKYRNGRRIMIVIAIVICLFDYFIGTPNLAEALAYKTTSLVSQGGASLGKDLATKTNEWNVEETALPVRIGVALLLTAGVLLITFVSKWVTNTQKERDRLQALLPGDDQGFRSAKRNIMFKNLGRFAWLGLFAAGFVYLYQFDVDKEKDLILSEQIGLDEDLTKVDWMAHDTSNMGDNNESSAQLPFMQNSLTAEEMNKLAHDRARPSLWVYTCIFVMHALLILLPDRKKPDINVAFEFNQAKSETTSRENRVNQNRLLRGLSTRIEEENDSDIRMALLRETLPVARQINIARGDNSIPLPDNSEFLDDSAFNGGRRPAIELPPIDYTPMGNTSPIDSDPLAPPPVSYAREESPRSRPQPSNEDLQDIIFG